MKGLALYASLGGDTVDDLISRGAPQVKRIAYHLLARLPASVQVDDLIQAGMLGLLEAAHRYDPAQGANFAT
ncbi:MAG: RNA polymerase sigma factor FliA, partial [Leptospiraceae bacterium]|nr:RNA polymerase sigma factor FliA [Leptospiraceae bacterium]